MQRKIQQLIRKGKQANTMSQDKQEMLALFHRPEIEYELKSHLLEELNDTLIPDKDESDFQRMFSKLWSKIEGRQTPSKSKVRLLHQITRIAAILVLGLILGGGITMIIQQEDPVYHMAHSPRGSVSDLLLPDGSVIYLNADSRIEYSVEGKKGKREVFLYGEAWFDVAKDPKRPFLVHTSAYDIYVTGTRFNIKAHDSDKDVITTLEEGEVHLKSTDDFRLEKDIILKPGEQAFLDKDAKTIAVKSVNAEWYSSWKENKLIFINMSMKELEVTLERKYGVEINVKDKDLLDLHFDGTIKNETIIEVLEILKIALPIEYHITDQTIEIISK